MADRSSKSAIVSYETDLIALHHQPELSDPDGSSALGIETVERVDLCFNVLDSLIPKVGQYGRTLQLVRAELFEAVYSTALTATEQGPQRLPYAFLCQRLETDRDKAIQSCEEALAQSNKEALKHAELMTRDNLKTLSLEETIVELRQAAAKADDKVVKATCSMRTEVEMLQARVKTQAATNECLNNQLAEAKQNVFADKKELEHHSRHTLTFEQLHTRCLTFPEPALAKGVQTQRLGQVTVGSRDALQRSLSQLLTARDRLVTNYMTQLGALHTAWIHRCQPVVAQGTLFCYKRTLNPNNIEVPSTLSTERTEFEESFRLATAEVHGTRRQLARHDSILKLLNSRDQLKFAIQDQFFESISTVSSHVGDVEPCQVIVGDGDLESRLTQPLWERFGTRHLVLRSATGTMAPDAILDLLSHFVLELQQDDHKLNTDFNQLLAKPKSFQRCFYEHMEATVPSVPAATSTIQDVLWGLEQVDSRSSWLLQLARDVFERNRCCHILKYALALSDLACTLEIANSDTFKVLLQEMYPWLSMEMVEELGLAYTSYANGSHSPQVASAFLVKLLVTKLEPLLLQVARQLQGDSVLVDVVPFSNMSDVYVQHCGREAPRRVLFAFHQQAMQDGGREDKLPLMQAADVTTAAIMHQLFDARASALVDALDKLPQQARMLRKQERLTELVTSAASRAMLASVKVNVLPTVAQ